MKRLTTDRPEDNVQSTLNLFYIKNKETWIRGGGPAPQYRDVSLDDFMRRMIKERMAKWDLEVKVPEDWRGFSCMMAEWLFDEPESETGMLALLYAAAWGFAEIRERLKRYEDTGAMPDVLEELLESLARIEKLGGWDQVDRWVKAAAEGRLVDLPCKVGDTVWIKNHKFAAEIESISIGGKDGPCFEWTEYDRGFDLTEVWDEGYFTEKEIGKTVFLTREEAEAALKGEGHGEQV